MIPRSLILTLSVGTFLTAGFASQQAAAKPKRRTVEFNRDVRPLLAQHCWPCHGADKAAVAKTGGVRFDTPVGAKASGAFIAGHPETSRALARIGQGDMPPKGSGIKPLTAAETQILKTWVSEGAEYRAHWAFLPPKMPALPTVKDAKWVRNDIDRFVLAGLEEKGLKPETEADRRTLIRRASLTLTGLPPTPEETNRFLADTAPNAYERLVDRFLASPRYGENQARYWLDAVRYADTHGLHIDNERSVYPYRDWVVRAYNEDLPYDKFVLWQLAGDLLPNPTLDQRIATGYVRLNPTTNEGGVIEAEFLAKNTFDRVDTTSTVFMGVTLQCAKCHDHKYDPFTQKDYYRMYAYFNSTADTPLDGNARLHAPFIKAPSPEQATQLANLEKLRKDALAQADVAEATRWAEASLPPAPQVTGWEVSGPYAAKDFDTTYDTAFAPETGGGTWRSIDLKLDMAKAGVVGKENAAAYLRATVTAPKAETVEMRVGSDDAVRVWINDKPVHANKVLRGTSDKPDLVKLPLEAGENRLLVKIVNGVGEDGAVVGFGGPDTLRISRALEKVRTGKGTDDLAETYLALGPETPAAASFRKADAAYRAQDAMVPMTYVAEEMPKPRPTFLLRRGEYNLPGEPVTRGVPAVFKPAPQTDNNRLGLAKWIIDPQNPLTARVIVNRIWQQHFGNGIVKSSDDFGSRGDWPTDPELLDYLACRFVKDGWSVKKINRLIVTSAAFRQAATSSEAKRAKDPDNSFISRGPRFRLDAEVIRDSALYAAGLLKEHMGGHSDKPYQPPGLWEIIAYPISDTAKYMQDHGDALYRRSLYMFWKRTSPPPTMLLFDAPMRESCVVRRSRTNTPTQALATLNETGFFEDARAMAQRVMETKSDDVARLDYAFRLATNRPPTAQEMTVIQGFLADARSRYKSDAKAAEGVLKIGESPRDTSLPADEHAAWTLVCNLILNLDETLTQH